MILSQKVTWDSPFEPEAVEPGSTAPPGAIVEYLHEMDALGAFDGHLSRGGVVRYCHHRGHLRRPLFKLADVFEGLDALSAAAYRRQLPSVKHAVAEWKSLKEFGQIPDSVLGCPRLVWRMDKKTGRIFWFLANCDSFLCERKCAEARVEENLLWACRMFRLVERVWVGTMPDRGKPSTYLLRTRRGRAGKRRDLAGPEGTLWVRRADKQLYIFSTTDLSLPGMAPAHGEWISPREALELLVGTTLALPGVKKVQWAGLWKRPAARRPPGRSFDLGGPPMDVMEDARAEAEDALSEQHGLSPDSLSEEQVQTLWLPLVQEALKHQRELRKKAKDAPTD